MANSTTPLEIVSAFIEDRKATKKLASLSRHGEAVSSYGRHFPVIIRDTTIPALTFYRVNAGRSSPTTNRHVHAAFFTAIRHGYRVLGIQTVGNHAYNVMIMPHDAHLVRARLGTALQSVCLDEHPYSVAGVMSPDALTNRAPGRKHYHVNGAFPGCLPESGDVYLTKKDAIAGARDTIATYKDAYEDCAIVGNLAKDGGVTIERERGNTNQLPRSLTIEHCTERACFYDNGDVIETYS